MRDLRPDLMPASAGAVPLPPLWQYVPRPGGALAVRSRRHVEAEIVARAARDPAFRQALLDDPSTALAACGASLPPDTACVVLEETTTTLHLVLPASPYGSAEATTMADALGLALDEVARWQADEQATPLLDRATLAAVYARAWRDRAFVDALRDDAAAALAADFDVTMPAGAVVQLFEESDTAIAVVLPAIGAEPGGDVAWQEEQDELLMQILASPCFNSFPDPCCTRTLVIP